MKKVLITGVTGMVGSHLVDFLLAETNWELTGACRWRSPKDNLNHLISNSKFASRLKFVEMDLNDSSSILEVLSQNEFDFVFHLASASFPGSSFISPQITLETNIIGTVRLLEGIKFLRQDPVIHICSSSEVFGKVSSEYLPIREDAPYKPASPYSISKVGTDLLGIFYHEAYHLKTLITRMFTHTGPRRGAVFAESSFARQIALIEAGFSEKKIYVGNLNSVRTWADVRDAVNAYYLLVTKVTNYGQTFNIGGTKVMQIGDALNFLLSNSPIGRQIEVVESDKRIRPIDADAQIPDTTKFIEQTGWTPKFTFEQTMLDLLAYWRKRIEEGRPDLEIL